MEGMQIPPDSESHSGRQAVPHLPYRWGLLCFRSGTGAHGARQLIMGLSVNPCMDRFVMAKLDHTTKSERLEHLSASLVVAMASSMFPLLSHLNFIPMNQIFPCFL